MPAGGGSSLLSPPIQVLIPPDAASQTHPGTVWLQLPGSPFAQGRCHTDSPSGSHLETDSVLAGVTGKEGARVSLLGHRYSFPTPQTREMSWVKYLPFFAKPENTGDTSFCK